MAEQRFLNPYNFVRPLAKPAPIDTLLAKNPNEWTQEETDQILLWRCPPPPHDRYSGLSGRITCTMTAKTPVFVSDSEFFYQNEEDKNKDHKTYPFFNVYGEDMIPASSLRGAIRSVFEAATNSTFGAFGFGDKEDKDYKPLFYRWSPDAALGFVPGRVEWDERSESGYRLRLLTGSYDLEIGSKNLYAAWIPQYPNPGTKRPKHLVTEIVEIPDELQDGQVKCWAYVVNTRRLIQRETPNENQRKGFPHWQVEHIAKTEQEARDWFRELANDQKKQEQNGQVARYKLVSGYVYATGLNAQEKQYERFFFYTDKTDMVACPQLAKKVIETYNDLMSDSQNRCEIITKSLDSQYKDGGREVSPSYFVTVEKPVTLRGGTLVYADLEGTNDNPSIRAIYPVAAPRAIYERSVRDVIAAHHPYLLPPTNINELCLASRVFGWVSQEQPRNEDERRKNLEVAYRGRVRFSQAKVINAKKVNHPITLSILGAPHPTSLEFYLDGITSIKPQRNAKHGYDEQDAKIRGRKMYRHHKSWEVKHPPEEPGKTQKEATRKERDNQNRTIQGIYQPESFWEFTIEFENLQPVELGALLWTLELKEDSKQAYHRIGYGKPLGFGSVQINVDELELYDASTRYTHEQTGLKNGKGYMATLIERFRERMCKLYSGATFDQLANIKDLLKLLCEPADLPIHYPRLDYKGKEAPGNEGFQWFVKNRNGKQVRLKSVHEDDGLPYDVAADNQTE